MKHKFPLVDGHGNVVQDPFKKKPNLKETRALWNFRSSLHRKEPEESDLAFLSSVRTEAVCRCARFLGSKPVTFGGDALPAPIRCWATGLKLLICMGFHGSEINMEVL